ncbi:hypothetical protein HUU51_01770 [Candidatus Gracilibacteria bacterium]|nr:hypothetical protein [Candidatus Gracilibacteria bacterium]
MFSGIIRIIVLGNILYISKYILTENISYLCFILSLTGIILLFLLLFFIGYINNLLRTFYQFIKSFYLVKNTDSIFFLNDKPIDKKEDDIYSLFSEKTKINILKILKQDINAFHINGKWGEGKTSLYNLLKEELNKTFEIYEFNPWYISIEKNIISSFLEGLSKNFSYINNQVEDLKKLLVKNEKTFWFIELFFHNKSIEQLKNNINNKFKYKKLLIIIDDLDRLTKAEEIMEVLKIIGEFERYNNIKFLLLFDKPLLEEKIRDVVKDNNYLKKIIQYSYNLKIKEKDLKKYFEDKIQELTNNNLSNNIYSRHNTDEGSLSYFGINYHIKNGFFKYSIKNLRDCKLYLNRFYIKYDLLNNEVNISDLFELTILDVFYEEIYKDIIENGKFAYVSKFYSSGSDNKNYGFIKENIEMLIKRYNTNEQTYIKEILFNLFPEIKGAFGANIPRKYGNSYDWNNTMKIELPDYFNKYFLEDIPEEISDKLLFYKLENFNSSTELEKVNFMNEQSQFKRVISHCNYIKNHNEFIEWNINYINNYCFIGDNISLFTNISTLIQKIIDIKNDRKKSDYKLELYKNIIYNCKNILFLLIFVNCYISKDSWNERNYEEFYNNLKEILKNKINEIINSGGNIYQGIKKENINVFEYEDMGLPAILGKDYKKI